MTDETYLKYNARPVHARTIDTLIGLSKGILADGVVNQKEAAALLSWLEVNKAMVGDNPVVDGLLARVHEMLWDDVLDDEEAQELHNILDGLSGGISEFGEMSRSATFPLDRPAPQVVFSGQYFLFTGQFLYGNRTACNQAVLERGGEVLERVTKRLDYLVIGIYTTPTWRHESFGNKIRRAIEYRDGGKSNLAIVSEEHWMRETERTHV